MTCRVFWGDEDMHQATQDEDVADDGKGFTVTRLTKKANALLRISRRIMAKMIFQAPTKTHQNRRNALL